MVGMVITIFGPVFSQSLTALVASEICCGFFWGGAHNTPSCSFKSTNALTVFQTLTTAYASEVCPIALRHYLTA
jgi:SP family general alpha glucoside:H+ symporter-like MFS transporter